MTDYAELWSEIADAVLPLLHQYRRSLGSMSIATKPDGTLVCEADIAVQKAIVHILGKYDPLSSTVCEESPAPPSLADAQERLWVVDPIDGTSQFVDPARTEFCSVVAVLEAGEPAGCMILAPELGVGRQPVLLTLAGRGQEPRLNGQPAHPACRTRYVSTTRSSRVPQAAAELLAIRLGLAPKTRATSQTLDMARTALNLQPATGLASFRWFAATRQLLWDAAAGLALAKSMGLSVTDQQGRPALPVRPAAGAVPVLPSILVARPRDSEFLTAQLATSSGPEPNSERP